MSTSPTLSPAPKGRMTPMKILKVAMIILGLAAIAAGIFYLVQTTWDMREVMGAANSGRSTKFESPMATIYLMSGLALLGGLVLGIGLGMPRRTAKAISDGVALDGYTETTRAKAAARDRERMANEMEKRERQHAKELEAAQARREREARDAAPATTSATAAAPAASAVPSSPDGATPSRFAPSADLGEPPVTQADDGPRPTPSADRAGSRGDVDAGRDPASAEHIEIDYDAYLDDEPEGPRG